MVLATKVVQLEEEIGLTWVGSNQFTQLCHHLVVQQFRCQRDGDTVNGTFLDGLQELNTCNAQILRAIGIIREARSYLASDIYRRTNGEESRLVAPRFAKQWQFTRTHEIFQGHNTKRFTRLRKSSTYSGDNSSECDIFTIGQAVDICQFVTSGITQVVENNLIFVQRMCRQVDTHQLPFLVQTLNITPSFFTLRQRRRLYLQSAKISEQ